MFIMSSFSYSEYIDTLRDFLLDDPLIFCPESNLQFIKNLIYDRSYPGFTDTLPTILSS